MGSGPVIFGFDGSPASLHALNETAPLLSTQEVLVVVVWEAGRPFDTLENPSLLLDQPVASLDLRAAYEADESAYQAALRMAEHGARLATNAGMKAEGLAVADELPVADTLVRLAEERDARAVVVGAHSHSKLSQILLGTTTQGVLDKAKCPVIVTHERKHGD
jgi:nucleotide-binding universal stress UspA family protein